jgi:hypothetical protein
VKPYDDKPWLSRGVSPRQSVDDEATLLDGVIPPPEWIPHHPDVIEPLRNFDSIAVVVGKKPVSQRQAPQ